MAYAATVGAGLIVGGLAYEYGNTVVKLFQQAVNANARRDASIGKQIDADSSIPWPSPSELAKLRIVWKQQLQEVLAKAREKDPDINHEKLLHAFLLAGDPIDPESIQFLRQQAADTSDYQKPSAQESLAKALLNGENIDQRNAAEAAAIFAQFAPSEYSDCMKAYALWKTGDPENQKIAAEIWRSKGKAIDDMLARALEIAELRDEESRLEGRNPAKSQTRRLVLACGLSKMFSDIRKASQLAMKKYPASTSVASVVPRQ